MIVGLAHQPPSQELGQNVETFLLGKSLYVVMVVGFADNIRGPCMHMPINRWTLYVHQRKEHKTFNLEMATF